MQHKFVDLIPDEISPDTLFISLEYGTCVHLCGCGCKNEVVTPLSPSDWKLTYDGETISLHPSIGNWSFDCRSHYFVKNNKISWCKDSGDALTRQAQRASEQPKNKSVFSKLKQLYNRYFH